MTEAQATQAETGRSAPNTADFVCRVGSQVGVDARVGAGAEQA